MTQAHLLRGPILKNALSFGASEGMPRVGRGRHLEPGVVKYDQPDGSSITYLLTREAIAAMRPTAKGKPIVGKAGGFDHMRVNAEDQAAGKYDGSVVESYADSDGWESILFQLKDDETAAACEDGYEFSCAYYPTEVEDKPGAWHNVPYDAVIKNGEYTHFAVVPNPRYDGAKIELLNSQDGGIVNKTIKTLLSALVPLKQLKEIVNSIEDDAKKEDEARMKERAEKVNAMRAEAKNAYEAAMGAAKTDEEKVAAKGAYDKANAMADEHEKSPLGGGDVPPEPGVPQQAPTAQRKENAESAEEKAAREEREKKAAEAKALEEKKNAEEAEAKKKAEKEAAEKKAAEEMKNALEIKKKAEADAKAEAERQERFNNLRRLAEDRGGSSGTPFVGVVTLDEKENLGRDRYGSRE